jgi:hypothetical protein
MVLRLDFGSSSPFGITPAGLDLQHAHSQFAKRRARIHCSFGVKARQALVQQISPGVSVQMNETAAAATTRAAQPERPHV